MISFVRFLKAIILFLKVDTILYIRGLSSREWRFQEGPKKNILEKVYKQGKYALPWNSPSLHNFAEVLEVFYNFFLVTLGRFLLHEFGCFLNTFCSL